MRGRHGDGENSPNQKEFRVDLRDEPLLGLSRNTLVVETKSERGI